jgi:DNA-binding response OmpR family regulator
MPDANQRVKILVVDDEIFLAESLAENLRDSAHHYDAYWVNSGKRALEFLDKQPVDLIVSDIKMADTSGLQLLNQVRIKHPTVKVILMTGYGLPDIEEEALRRGSLFYLEKPFVVGQLEAAIEQVLRPEIKEIQPIEAQESAEEMKAAEEAPEVTAAISEDKMERLLKEVLKASDWITGGALLEGDGTLVASNSPELVGESREKLIMVASQLLKASNSALASFDQGERAGALNLVLIQGERGNIIFTRVGHQRFLLFLTNSQANLGLVLLQIRQRARAAEELMAN